MITQKDQLELFRLISMNIEQNVECFALGGTAMMFYGYKNETKDIDIIFEQEEQRKAFIAAIKNIGYQETSPVTIYIADKLKDHNKPLMFKRGDSRFDLFVKKIFQTILSQKMQEDIFAIHQFKTKHTLTVKILKKEIIVLLKAVTERDKDFEDILNIIKKSNDFNWQYFIDEVLWQSHHGDSWVLLDVEKMLQELKKYVFIEEKWFNQLYQSKK